jgi:hypothetical protein
VPEEEGALTARERVWVVVLLVASVIFALKLKVPVWVVIPESCPPLLKEKPVGREPDATVHW